MVEVDLKDFIFKQNDFTKTILMQIENSICEKIEIHKKKFKGMALANLLNDLDSNIQFVYRGIYDNNHMANFGLKEMEKTIAKVKQELNTRYNNRIPESVECIFRLQDYIINKVEKWISNHEIYKNIEAEIYMDSFDKQLEELRTILTEIDHEFGN